VNNQIIAVISDIHGNSWALEKVLNDIDTRGISNIVNLGDCFYGPLDPSGTADLLLARQIPTVCGNEDRIILDDSKQSEILTFVRQNLNPEHLNWLINLGSTLSINNILLLHGTPSTDTEYLLWEVGHDNVVQSRSVSEVKDRLDEVNDKIILCGHSHVPNEIKLSDNTCVIDVGSVGLQAYTDELPYNHKMEAGSPHARYAILEIDNNTVTIQRVKIEYEWEEAAQTAENNGRADWAGWLRTGLAERNLQLK
jgi:predicted phosphodiesterase